MRNPARNPAAPALLIAAVILSTPAVGAIRVPIHLVDTDGVGRMIGHVSITESEYGLVFTPDLDGLPAGPALRGFHLHENASCEPGEEDGEAVAALSAGEHYDPHRTDRHGAPWGDGHLGDLPAIWVDDKGRANHPVLAPRLDLDALDGLSLIVHAHDDNYSDHPDSTGGAGDRVACGVIGGD